MENKFTIEVRAKGFGKLKNEVEQANKSLGTMEKQKSRIRLATNGLTRAVGALRNRFLLFAFATAGATKVVKTFVNASAGFEAVRTRLTGLTGSVSKARIAFDNFNAVASTTPFSLDDVVNAGAQLQAFGADANALIKPITDLAAFMGTTATEAANAFGRAFAGGAGAADILRERGILNIIKSSQGIADLSKTTLPEFRQALISSLQDPVVGIQGSTDRLSKTTVGSISNMKDAFTRLAASLGDRFKPQTDLAVQSLTKLFNTLRGFVEVAPVDTTQELFNSFDNLTTRIKGNSLALRENAGEALFVDEIFKSTIERQKTHREVLGDLTNLTHEEALAVRQSIMSREDEKAILEETKISLQNLSSELVNQLNTRKLLIESSVIENTALQVLRDNTITTVGVQANQLELLERVRELEPYDPISNALSVLSVRQSAAIGLTNKISETFIQAGINGQKMGEAVITSLKSIAAEIAAQAITFGLLKSFFAPGTLGMGGLDFVLRGFGVRHQGGPVQKFNSGGMVQGRDNVPILAQAGEYVIRRDSAQAIGLDTLNQINETGQTGSMTVNISAPLVDETIVDTIIPAIQKASRFNLA